MQMPSLMEPRLWGRDVRERSEWVQETPEVDGSPGCRVQSPGSRVLCALCGHEEGEPHGPF